jgi:hypothetical protein
MKKSEIKQTQIYKFFSINKKTNISIRSILDENKFTYNSFLKRSYGKKEKNEFDNSKNHNKNSNLKIKDFFSFKEYTEDVDNLQKDLKNMLIQSDNNKKNLSFKKITQEIKISSFNYFPELKIFNINNISNVVENGNLQIIGLSNINNQTNETDLNSKFNNCLNNIQIDRKNINYNNDENNLKDLNMKTKNNNFGISKYFSFIENNQNESKKKNTSIFKDKEEKNHKNIIEFNNNKIIESEKVFTLDHFNNKYINETIEDNILNINLKYTLKNKDYFTNLHDSKKSTDILNNDKKIIENHNNDLKSQNLTENFFFKILPKKKYHDVKISNYLNIKEPTNMKLNRELLVNVLEFVDLRNLINKIPQVCRFWYDLYNKTISSANYNSKIDLRDNFQINEKEVKILFKKGKNLKHIKILRDIISEDFGGIKGVGNFLKKIELIMQLSNPKDIYYKGVMLSSFKIKPKRGFEMNNFISNKSINLICENSKFSLKTLILRNCTKLSNRVFDGISSCIFLNNLEISFNE